MVLDAGLRFRVAPRFHCRAAWAERLRVNGGVVRGAAGVQPRDDWRPPTAGELALVVAGEVAASSPPGGPHLDLLVIPSHLRRRWWELAARSDAGGTAIPGFAAFVGEVVELLRFKRLPLPAACLADVVVSRPGQASTRLDEAGGRLAGFAFGSLAPARRAAHSAPVAAINLGDESARLVVLNLALAALRARRAGPDAAAEAAVLDAFFAEHPAYPLIGVRLDPGEGLWLPTPPPAFDGWTIGKTDVDALLLLHAAPPAY